MNSPASGQRKTRHTRKPRSGTRPGWTRLTDEEIARLASRIAGGDVEARNTLVQANLFLVYRIARRYNNRGLTLEDLIGEGSLGLIRAAQGYNPELGTSFSTYATYWIKEAILTALINTAGTIRLPMNVSKLLGRWRRTEKAISRKQGHSPTFEEVAKAMGLDEATQGLLAKAHVVSQMQVESVLTEGREAWACMTLGGCSAPGDALEAKDEQSYVFRRLERLAGRERSAVIMRFGLAGESPMSLNDIGRRLGISVDAVRKLVAGAMEELAGSRQTRPATPAPAFGTRVG